MGASENKALVRRLFEQGMNERKAEIFSECVAPDFVMQSWTRPTSAMQGWVARSWSGPPCVAPICGARICAWQSSTVRIYPMPISAAPMA